MTTENAPSPESPPSAAGSIDAHHHFWRTPEHHQHWRDTGLPTLARDFEPADLAVELERTGVAGTVLVESLDVPAENRYLLEYAAQTPTVLGVVGWLPLRDPAAAVKTLDELAGHPVVRGIRYLIGRDPADWLVEPRTIEVLRELARRGLAWDIVPVTSGHVDHVCTIAEAVPDLRIVADHLARPPLDTGGWEPWASGIARLASHPNVALKLSVGIDVLTRWPAWQPERLGRYVGRALEQFGPRRLMVASNWPVIMVRRTYAETMADLLAALGTGVAPDDLAEVRAGTARRWYRLPT
ncbi:amidohydrolase family protein [Actinopolymorpha sp. B9G3]|uniref:amidohydrolase family protein n=1 Tax=Actinopolymorpha sp. B9G3 TaxID=3158970 RepID=UPI0032D8C3A2